MCVCVCVCVWLKSGRCYSVYHALRGLCTVLIDEYVCFCVLCVSSKCNPISHPKQNHIVFATWIFHSKAYALFSLHSHPLPCRPFSRFTYCRCANNKEAFHKWFPINMTKTINLSTSPHIAICILNANVTLYILPHCLVTPTLANNTYPHQCHSFCSVTHKSSSLWISETHFTTPFPSFFPHSCLCLLKINVT